MIKQRSWISLIGFCMGAVLLASLALAAVVAGASVALASHPHEGVAEEGRDVTPAIPAPRQERHSLVWSQTLTAVPAT